MMHRQQTCETVRRTDRLEIASEGLEWQLCIGISWALAAGHVAETVLGRWSSGLLSSLYRLPSVICYRVIYVNQGWPKTLLCSWAIGRRRHIAEVAVENISLKSLPCLPSTPVSKALEEVKKIYHYSLDLIKYK